MDKEEKLLSEEEEALLQLTEDREKEFFTGLWKAADHKVELLLKKYPRLSVSFYLYKYKKAGESFEVYREAVADDLTLFQTESQAGQKSPGRSENRLRARSKQLEKEAMEESRRGRKNNFRYAGLLLVIVFLFLVAAYWMK